MATYRGTIRKSEFGGGFELHGDDGEIYELQGDGPFAEGTKVEIDGSIDESAMSISMRGPTLRVKSQRRI